MSRRLGEREVGSADCRQLGVLKNDHPSTGDLGTEVDVNVGPDLAEVAFEVSEAVKRGAISRKPDRVEPGLEVGDRVGAVAPGEVEPVGPGPAGEHVVTAAAVQHVAAVAAIEDEAHGGRGYCGRIDHVIPSEPVDDECAGRVGLAKHDRAPKARQSDHAVIDRDPDVIVTGGAAVLTWRSDIRRSCR
jgi:hypothetical protein